MDLSLLPERTPGFRLGPDQCLGPSTGRVYGKTPEMYSIHLKPERHTVATVIGAPQGVGIQPGSIPGVPITCLDINVVSQSDW